MSSTIQDTKPVEGSIQEKDTQMGTIEEIYIDPIAEKKVSVVRPKACLALTKFQLIRKLDLMLSPMMVLIFLVAYLDRSNIGMIGSIRSKINTDLDRQCCHRGHE